MRSRVLIATLAAAALTFGCVSEQTYKAEVQKTALYEQLSAKLQTELNADQAQIEQLQNEVKLTLVDQLLFPEGGWQIHRKGEETLAKIAPTLSTVQAKRIVVEGYTDNVPIGPELKKRFPSNWELSTARATDVLRYLAAKGVPQSLLAAEGFGDTRPVASNDTPQGRAKNRRVEIVISGVSQ
ncbi:flagellar motor protein MotB [Accumulibacter sp.]|uniref:OmpA/MotB family protein n=1 Tax=Accumulibacter sp. TaxID=2053492 RepID=UPI001D492828|nr:flagellar motor protein MotB [Accumulibacter sp.]MCB1930999.1 flagellar motor protein MotB [Accumulibacter sp.]MCB1966386.1 flagellar motor protein MotB [Accumulibacter sp.]MCP5228861.1 flagellar motor protein MotB [Accumulibacter sp.]